MDTIIEKVTEDSIKRAAEIIKRGGLVAFPTETVYGLGANGLDGEAAARIYTAKGRPADNPLILHIAQKNEVYALAAEVPAEAQRLMDAFWPGALTIILPKKAHIPEIVSAGLETVGVRMPSHPAARALIAAAGLPLAAPSANASGRPSPTLAEHVAHDLGGRIDMILDGGATECGLESTVVEATAEGVCVLRPGAVTLEDLRGVVPDVWLDTGSTAAPKAPGMKYTHYSPLAEVILVTGAPERVAEYIRTAAAASEAPVGILTARNGYDSGKDIVLSLGARQEDAAANLFAMLREFDRRGVTRVYAEGVDERGLGLAVMNRLGKAAGLVVEV